MEGDADNRRSIVRRTPVQLPCERNLDHAILKMIRQERQGTVSGRSGFPHSLAICLRQFHAECLPTEIRRGLRDDVV